MASRITESDKQLLKEHKSLLKFQISEVKSGLKMPQTSKEKEGESADVYAHSPKFSRLDLTQLATQTPSSSTSSTVESSGSESEASEELGVVAVEEEEEEEEKIEETTTSSEEDYMVEDVEHAPLFDFFDNLDSLIPDLDEISLTPSVVTEASVISIKESVEPTADVGKFVKLVDPGAGIDDFFQDADQEDKETQEQEIELQGEEEEEEGKEDEDKVEEIESVEFSFDFEAVDEYFEGKLDEEIAEGDKKPDEEEAAFATFLEMQVEVPVSISAIEDVEERKKEEEARETRLLTAQFLQDLIETCVKMAEQMDVTAYMRKNLNKSKIMMELKATIPLLISEQWARQFLNRKCVEHFRRIKGFRRLTENPKTVIQDMDRFHEIMIQLDELLGKESEVISLTKSKEIELTEQLAELEHKAKDEVEKLENLIKHTLNPNNSARIGNVVNTSVQRMDETRNEISKIRFRMILEQHKYASLVEKLRKLEDFGNNLSMGGFENMHTETLSLAKKLEERTVDLNRLRSRCHTDIHTMAHLKEREKMVRDTIANQKTVLEAKYFEKEALRERIVELKIQRTRVRKEIRELSFKSGLLDKPSLLQDYHHTEEYLENLQKRVKKMRLTTKQLTKKIEFLEKLCKPVAADRAE
uniref:DUF4201 domain-containing protein n=1 Tax=Glossina brevipalpis TaxID=37001 RepID=A0A1A9X4U7_9MUSC